MLRGGTFICLVVFFSLYLAGTATWPDNRETITQYRGKVVRVSDGDSLTLLVKQKEIKIRLTQVDAPEYGQPYSARSKQLLSRLVYGKQVTARVEAIDDYGRKVARVYVGNLDVNAEMVRQGAAWVYRKYARDESLFRLEQEARDAGRGIWGLAETEQTPPWEWRHGKR
ncbi:MAG TPA: thermonuclease family protein [Gammaproteobacteria bacterium]|nr:thermonuclease family protein [Gammaproteobacteria bacterium]